MPSFVANFQSPYDLDELEWFLHEGLATNLGCLFELEPGEPLGMWNVPKWARVGDRVFFMCAATTVQHMAHVCKQARDSKREDLIAFADAERDQYRRCAAHILAVGRVAAAPVPPQNGGSQALWWAPIRDFVLLPISVEPERWKKVFKVSQTGSITKLGDDQAEALEELVWARNPYTKVPTYQQGIADAQSMLEMAMHYAGLLALDPGRLIASGTSANGTSATRYEMSSVVRDFERDFWSLGFLDIDYKNRLQSMGVWPEGTSPADLDVSSFSAPAVIAVISTCVCDEYMEAGSLYWGISSGLVDRCLYRLVELVDPYVAKRLVAWRLASRIARAEAYLASDDADALTLLDQESADMVRGSLIDIIGFAQELQTSLPVSKRSGRDSHSADSDECSGAQEFVDEWTLGLGVMREPLRDGGASARPSRRALKGDWKTLPMPVERTEIELRLPVKAEEFEILSMGHIPRAMEDHWFMYFDGDALCFHRSWTGICIYKVHVEHATEGDGYVLSRITTNRDCGQYSETNDESDRILVLILIGQALGKDVESLWEAHHRIGHGERPAMNSATTTVLGFWQAGEANGYLSNWSDAGFELMERRFSTTEHWIMWQKARVMGDESTAAAILQAHGPKQAKALGGQASPYDDGVWCDVREELAYVGVREKFLQNPDLARQLLATGDLVLAEASPYDHVWGVGTSVSDKGFSDMTGWNGQNLQGRICMRVRADLRMLMPDGPTRHEQGTDKDDIEAVLASTVGKMSLLALARNPLTRSAALCYARIAGHAAQMQDNNVHHLLMDRGRASLATIDKDVRAGAKHYFSEAGWYELLVQLAFLRRVGLL